MPWTTRHARAARYPVIAEHTALISSRQPDRSLTETHEFPLDFDLPVRAGGTLQQMPGTINDSNDSRHL